MNNQHDEDHEEIGRRLFAAVVGVKLGVTADFALEYYVPQELHTGWGELGCILESSADNAVEMLLSLKSGPIN